MSPIRMHEIEVDEDIYNFLKDHAEPFKDTPNSVLRRYLPLKSEGSEVKDSPTRQAVSRFPPGIPNALAEILEMIILVRKEGLTRVEATHEVADRRGIAFQSVLDKYCRQLGKRAFTIDQLLIPANTNQFKKLLVERFPHHIKVIDETFEKLEK